MIKLILRNWSYRKGRTSLLLAGALIISLGLGYLVGLAETSKGTINEHLEERWSLSYDILVRPQEAADPIEEIDNVVEPNFLSTLPGGISLDEWQKIQAIPGVEVAAPVAMLGTTSLHLFPEIPMSDWEPGLYRMQIVRTFSDGATDHEEVASNYYHWGHSSLVPSTRDSDRIEAHEETYGFYHELRRATEMDQSPKDAFRLPGNLYLEVLVAGVDPNQEAALVGLDKATTGQYFGTPPQLQVVENPDQPTNLPIIASEIPPTNLHLDITVERLPLTLDSEQKEKLKEQGGRDYLDTLKGQQVAHHLITPQEIQTHMPHPIDLEAKAAELRALIEEGLMPTLNRPDLFSIHLYNNAIAPLRYQRLETSPFADNWPNVYQVEPIGAMPLYTEAKDSPYYALFRDNPEGGRLETGLSDRIQFQVVGTFNPLNLSIKDDPLTELPMETYRPATATLRLDAEGSPVNPPVPLLPDPNPRGLLTSPPVYLTISPPLPSSAASGRSVPSGSRWPVPTASAKRASGPLSRWPRRSPRRPACGPISWRAPRPAGSWSKFWATPES